MVTYRLNNGHFDLKFNTTLRSSVTPKGEVENPYVNRKVVLYLVGLRVSQVGAPTSGHLSPALSLSLSLSDGLKSGSEQ